MSVPASAVGRATVDTALVLRIVTSSAADRAGEEIPVSDTLTIGRDLSCDIVLNEQSVSRRHATVEPTPEGLSVTDLGSGNGVWVGADRVQQKTIAAGDRFRVGSTIFECVRIAPNEALPRSPSLPPTLDMAAPRQAVAPAAGVATTRPFLVRIVEGTRAGTEFEILDGVATIGRATDCTVVFENRDISRKHARIEWTPDGYLVTDTNSTAGIWVGSRPVKTYVLKPGESIRLGDTVVLECVAIEVQDAARQAVPPEIAAVEPILPAAPPAAPAPDVSPDATRFVSASELAAAIARPQPAAEAPPASSDATRFVSLSELNAAAAQPAAPAQKRDKKQPRAPKPPPVAELIPAVTDEDFSHTVVMRLPTAPTSSTSESWSIDREGELTDFSAYKPLLLDDPEHLWYVDSGGVLIFTVSVENGRPVGTRTHFLGIVPGQCFFGFDIASYGLGSGFLAVAKQGTKVRKISLARLREISGDPRQRPAIAGLIDNWVSGLASALIADFPTKRTGQIRLKAGERVELGTSTKATSAEGVVWLDIQSGSVMFDDMSTPTFNLRRTLFPLSTYSWIEPLNDEFGALIATPQPTAQALGDAASWAGLEVFHQALCESEFISKKLATVDEYVRLQQKAHESKAAAEAGYAAIGSVMQTDAATPTEFRATGLTEPVMRACRLVADAVGIELREAPSSEEDEQLALSFEDRVAIIASTSGFRTRVVALRDVWWTRDQGPMVGQFAANKEPVALLADGPKAYVAVDPQTGARQKVTPQVAATLSSFAYTLYRPFPEIALNVMGLLKFGSRGLSGDIRWVVMMAVIVGMAGTVTPYLTGQVFDQAIPQADRNMLYGMGIALVASALATSMFKLTQGIATVRMQAKMSSTIQAAVWDRLMNLPVTFFRQFSAGDLADRAGGVEQIQQLVAGAGVAAILGSVSGLFFVGQMFAYDLRLAMLAIVLTVTYVAVNMLCNYLQLRYQRAEVEMRGRISGLVLNLVSGVSKLRISGAEQHAFRVWATQFAQQRRITFKVGTIQNFAAVFGAVYPILSSIVIFIVVIGERQASTEDALTTGEFIAFNAAFGMFLAAMQALGDASLSLLKVVPTYERLLPILVTQPETDKSKAFPGKLTGAIELSHLHFRYTSDGPYIVKDISLKVKAGEFVAFVGESGCGKSTLMRLMLGFEQPTSGSIYYDGQDLPSLDLRMVRQQMGVVMQQSRVMPCEIFRNITGATTRTQEEAWEAAEKAGFADDIRAMPMGMHTYVSEGGGTLSGGQRQRLMICRAIVNKPKILFLDEATSALDNRTQSIVTESMNKMSATRIVIAHRLSTIQDADRICYCKAGEIVEMGTFAELMAKNGGFAELARRQMA